MRYARDNPRFVAQRTGGDRYENFAELAANETEGEDYRIVLIDRGSTVAVVAPHGGKIEPGSSEIAAAVAASDLSLYLFEGIADRNNRRLHITSARFDEPRAIALVSAADVAIGIHGRADDGDSVATWVGGRDRMLRRAVTAALIAAGFEAAAEGHRLPGEDPTNICNRGRSGAGVQLEIPASLRDDLVDDTDLRDSFAAAVRSAVRGR